MPRATRDCFRVTSSDRERSGTGCILEHGDGRWLQRGDVVESEVDGIGILRNTVA